jgi:phosphoglycerol transferase
MTDYLLLAASVTVFITGLFLARRTGSTLARVILLLGLSAIFFLLYDLYIVSYLFTGEWFDESVLFHIYYGVDGAGFVEYWQLIAGSLVFVIVGITGSYFVFSGGNTESVPGTDKCSIGVPYILVLAGIGLIPGNMQLAGTLIAEQKTDFHTFYRSPRITKAPDARRNIVMIYAEGLERTYFDEKLFPGLITELRELEAQSTYFTNLRQTWGTGWTIGGLTATQCGIPLVTPSHGNSMRGMDGFLDGAVCLGDLLAGDGYKLSYLGGAYLKFAGKGNFLSSHGFDDVRGRNALTPLLEDWKYMSPWGLYDDSLFDIAYQIYLDLSRTEQPFGLFMLTLDTHPPRGTPSHRCSTIKHGDGSNPILNAVACTDFLVGEFVRKIIESDYADNTVIIIASDHLSLKNTAYNLLKQEDRTSLLMIIEPGNEQEIEINRKGSALDVGAVVLDVLGYEGVLGLGRNLLRGEISLAENIDDINTTLRSWKDSLIEFWDFPKLEGDIVINATYREMTINDRTFKIPALITFNEGMETNIRFQFDRSPEHKSLVDYVAGLDRDTPFLWLDDCKTIKIVADNHGLCAVVGKPGSKDLGGFRINGKETIPLEDLRDAAKLESSDKEHAYNKSRMEG